MKKMSAEKKFSKLSLHRETLQALNPSQLAGAAGGGTGTSFTEPQFPSACSCCITECCG
jgi:hypothetical protein